MQDLNEVFQLLVRKHSLPSNEAVSRSTGGFITGRVTCTDACLLG